MATETQRLRLLPPSQVSAAALAGYMLRNRDFLADTSPLREESFYTEEGQAALLKEQETLISEGRAERLYIEPKDEPGKIIGFIALNNIVRGAFLSCHLGYQLDGAVKPRDLRSAREFHHRRQRGGRLPCAAYARP